MGKTFILRFFALRRWRGVEMLLEDTLIEVNVESSEYFELGGRQEMKRKWYECGGGGDKQSKNRERQASD